MVILSDVKLGLRRTQMPNSMFTFNLIALLTLIPAASIGVRGEFRRDTFFWVIMITAVLGPALWVFTSFSTNWRIDLGATMWVNITAILILYMIITLIEDESWRLAPILFPIVLLLGVLAVVWTSREDAKILDHRPDPIVVLHIAVSVVTYALVTIAAILAFGNILQENALKAKKPTQLTKILPAVTSCDKLIVRILVGGEVVLGTGLLTGIGVRFLETGSILILDHKTILTLTAFVLIAAVLSIHFKRGLRGRQTARWALLAYLLLTLGYPGVKFVKDVLIG